MTPFSVQCTTCRRSLKVVRPEAIGQILACPKCGSFILIEAPGVVDAAAAVGDTGVGQTGSIAVATATEVIPVAAPVPIEIVSEAPEYAVTEAWVPAPAAPVPPATVSVLQPTSAVRAEAQRWPRWFLPSASAILVVGLVAVLLRVALHKDAEAPIVPVTTNYGPETPAENSTPRIEPTNPTVEHDKPAIEPAQPAADVTAKPASDTTAKSASDTTVEPKNDTQSDASPDEMKKAVAEPATRLGDVAATSTAEIPSKSQPDASLPAAEPSAKSDELIIRPAEKSSPPAPPAVTPVAAAAAAPPEAAAAAPPHSPPAIPALRSLVRVSARRAHVENRLADPVAGFEVSKMPLWQFADAVSELSAIPITLDAQSLSNLGVSPATPIDLHLENTTVNGILEAALSPLKLSWRSEDGQLVVGYAPQENLRQVRYAIGDLASDPQSVAALAALVRQMVAPQSWREAGGKASLAAASDALVVDQSEPVHFELLSFCEKLRVARGKPIRSRYDPAKFSLTTHTQKARQLLTAPITANFASPRPISEVVAWLRPRIAGSLLIDHAALAREEMSAESECSVVAADKPFSAVLDGLCTSADLAWRAIDEHTVEITTKPAAADEMDVEFYAVADLVPDPAAASALIQRLTADAEPRIWGNDPTKAAIHYDALSHSLIIRAPQKTQIQVETLLATTRAKK